MKTSSLFVSVSAAFLVAGCGARTNDSDLLYYSLNGDGDGDGSGATGGARPTGGRGPAGGAGGTVITGGFHTGGFAAGGGVWSGGASTGGVFPTGGSGGLGSCCEASPFPGCARDDVMACVCSKDSFCCDNYWDGQCVEIAGNACEAGCSMGGTGGSGVGGMVHTGGAGAGGAGGSAAGGSGGSFECCSEHPEPGCNDMRVTACVCEQDAFCCENSWDSLCVRAADVSCEAECTPGSGGAPSTGGAGAGGGIGVGGTMAAGGSGAGGGGGAGGSIGAGGMSSGGSGGVLNQICESAFGDNDCGTCVCLSCFDQLSQCVGDVGCASIAACIIGTQCSDPISCSDPNVCGQQIADAGGLLSASTLRALQLGVCYAQSSCDCP